MTNAPQSSPARQRQIVRSLPPSSSATTLGAGCFASEPAGRSEPQSRPRPAPGQRRSPQAPGGEGGCGRAARRRARCPARPTTSSQSARNVWSIGVRRSRPAASSGTYWLLVMRAPPRVRLAALRALRARSRTPFHLDAERRCDLAVFEVGVVPHEHDEPLTLRQHGQPKAQLVIAGVGVAVHGVGGSKLDGRAAASLARTVQDASPHPAGERPAGLPLARVAQRVGKAFLNRLEGRITIPGDCSRDADEPGELRAIEQLELRPQRRLHH